MSKHSDLGKYRYVCDEHPDVPPTPAVSKRIAEEVRALFRTHRAHIEVLEWRKVEGE